MPSPKVRCDLDLISALLCVFRELPFVRLLRSGYMTVVTHPLSHRPCARKNSKAVYLEMSLRSAVIVMTFWTGTAAYAGTLQQLADTPPVPNVSRQEPLEDRVSSAPESVLKRFSNELGVNVSAHTVTPDERIILLNAFAQLTPFQREVLRNRLHAIYIMDGLPGNALTFPDGGPTADPMYSIAVRAGALHETVSELVTRKERTLFDSAGSELSVTVDGGTLNAMVYVFAARGNHIVDFAVGATPDPTHPSGNHPLANGIWRDVITPVDQYRLPILMGISYRRNGRVILITHAADLYDALARTPFISVYASCDSHDDLAELVAWTELTVRLHQPYRILISKGGIVIRVIEPAQSNLVQARLKYLSQLTGS
jgi:hypothetical protein